MKKIFLLICLTAFILNVDAQNDDRIKEVRKEMAKKDTTGWLIGTGIGFDFGQLLQINPAVGAGENRIAIGGLGSLFANYKNGKLAWDNNADLLLGVQKLGSGFSTLAVGEKVPFQKSIDELRFNSKLGYKTNETSKFYYSVLLTFLSQITPTYSDTSLVSPIKGNYLKDLSGKDQGPIAKFLSPARISFSPGIDYKPNANLSLFLSPASLKMVVVGDKNIAAIPARNASGEPFGGVNIHGTEWNGPNDYKQLLFQFGATFNAQYVNKFLNDKLNFKSGLTLFSNYLDNPQNVDVDWTTETAFTIFKGISVALNTRLFYDDNIPVQITDNNAVGGVRGLGNRVSFTEQLYLKYNYIF
ncbi:MAG: DUF3078 domain-containing protein [Saprospiraceae bacterium]|jgi:hypothetical protein|uniref:DUF3078 domain-containing protein n=1 Tax=Candidatus Brachybacter algidus TaxID=2982024 RepID=UPI001B4EF400|nr:DUF3078 domain-containing protein [Candidatus Brachybacter algidus]MBP7306573.1 DUF3078 domain-containing protein [Saprospiraceae bacterium]MBK6448409.1 DUF3078 domain-containing protein [Candidatus Brachybacter algidus]MBK8604150.1 DUF3078 domain-containing protein [Candidatus Brachybacter algidus]MBP7540789.1 DUF3078 domain-containing protein [Saprospiraceae bacterium]MBP8893681.1 DUF3078 domain-containing protein [Saprospiraceae bacterium]